MKPTRWRLLIALAAGTAVVTWGILAALRSHVRPPELASWAVSIVLLCAAGAVFTAGWPVRQYLRDPAAHGIDPLRAARVAALGKSAAIGGALLTGFYAAQAVIEATGVPVHDVRLWSAVAAAVSSLLLAITGMIVEGFCKLPPPSDAETTSRQGQAEPDSA